MTSVSTMRRPTRLELRSVTCAGSRFTGSATRPTTSVPAGCAPPGTTARSSSAVTSASTPPTVVIAMRIVTSSGVLPDRGAVTVAQPATSRKNRQVRGTIFF
jgi:hypothetical protein